MQAVVLVGGLGTRLLPLTERIPKQMLPVAGSPMIERVLAQLADHGVDRAVLSLGHLADPFTDAYPSHVIAGVEVSFAVEPTPLDTAGAIRFAADAAGIDEMFLVVNGDILTELDMTELVAEHRRCGGLATIALTPVADPSAYGVVVTDDSGCVDSFIEKPPAHSAPSNDINAGVYVFEPAVLERIEPARRVSVERDIFPSLVDERALYARVDTAYWLDLGTPAAYLQANLDVLSGAHAVVVDGKIEHGSLIGTGARLDSSATVSRSVIGRDVTVGAGARVERSVVLDGASIDDGASIVESIVGPRALVREGAALSATCLVGQGATVEARAALMGAKVA